MTYKEPFPEWEGKKHEDIMKDIADDVLDYITWYVENGEHLPVEFLDSPERWRETLREIEVAFSILVVGPSMESTKDSRRVVDQGIKLFNKHIKDMWI